MIFPFSFFFSRAPHPITGSLLQTRALPSVSLFPAESCLLRQGEREVWGREEREGATVSGLSSASFPSPRISQFFQGDCGEAAVGVLRS